MSMKFSIVVPVYNLKDCLVDTLESVIRQDGDDFECICVDDGSTDGSAAILNEYAAKDGRIKAIHIPNGGVCGARNRGMDEAKGEWLIFLDGDDVLLPGALAVLRRVIDEQKGIDAVKFERVEFTDQVGSAKVFSGTSSLQNMQELITEDVSESYFWQFCYRVAALKGLRFDPEIKYNMGEDCLFLSMALDRMGVIAKVDAELYGYRQRPGSAMHSLRTVEKWRYDFLHRRKKFDIIAQCPQKYDRRYLRRLGLTVNESIPTMMLKIETDNRHELWSVYFDFLCECRKYDYFTPWGKRIIALNAALKSRLTVWFLGVMVLTVKRFIYVNFVRRGRK